MDPPTAAAVLFVDDVSRIAAFYRAIARMEVLHANGDHVVLESAGFQLTVHALRHDGATSITRAYPTREDTHVKLCFPVEDLQAARTAAARLGGELWARDREWQARGFRACDGRDPEGNVFQLREPSP